MSRHKSPEYRRRKVRARLDAQLDRIESVHELEFLEMVATLSEQPFSEEMALEVLLEVAGHLATAKARHEMAVEKQRRADREGGRPA